MAMECKHEHQHLPKPEYFVDKIFEKYSNATLNYSLISFDDFEKMYAKLSIHADEHDDKHRRIRSKKPRQVLFQGKEDEFESVIISKKP